MIRVQLLLWSTDTYLFNKATQGYAENWKQNTKLFREQIFMHLVSAADMQQIRIGMNRMLGVALWEHKHVQRAACTRNCTKLIFYGWGKLSPGWCSNRKIEESIMPSPEGCSTADCKQTLQATTGGWRLGCSLQHKLALFSLDWKGNVTDMYFKCTPNKKNRLTG